MKTPAPRRTLSAIALIKLSTWQALSAIALITLVLWLAWAATEDAGFAYALESTLGLLGTIAVLLAFVLVGIYPIFYLTFFVFIIIRLFAREQRWKTISQRMILVMSLLILFKILIGLWFKSIFCC